MSQIQLQLMEELVKFEKIMKASGDVKFEKTGLAASSLVVELRMKVDSITKELERSSLLLNKVSK